MKSAPAEQVAEASPPPAPPAARDTPAAAHPEPPPATSAGPDEVFFRHGRSQADFRDGYRNGFAVSADGAVVDFAFEAGGKAVRFDLTGGTLEPGPAARSDVKTAQDAAGGVAVTEWRNGAQPRIAGRAVVLDANERARSVSVAADGRRVLLGTDFHLRLYTDGAAAWRTAVPAPAWSVVLTGDGRLAVAGLGDGTVRWFRVADGAEILAFYAHPDGRRWVAWTPEGFFDHGPGGEGFIGYHLNLVDQRRPKGAAFVRVGQLYSLFFRRDLVVRKFAGTAEADIAAQLAAIGDVRTVLGRGLPPAVRVTEYCRRRTAASECAPLPAESRTRGFRSRTPIVVDTPEVVLRFEIEDRGGGGGPIVLRRQGAPVGGVGVTRGITVRNGVQQQERVTLQPGMNLVSLSVFNAARQIETAPDERPELAILYEAPREEKPVLHVLSVGIDRFAEPTIPKLVNAVSDARGMIETIRGDRSQSVYREVDATLLADDQATLPAITAAFDGLATRARPGDIAVVFLAGHGVALDGKYYFVPYDLPALSADAIRAGALTHERLAQALGALPDIARLRRPRHLLQRRLRRQREPDRRDA